MTEKKRAMPKITMKEMVEFTNQWKESYIMDAELRGDHSEKYEQDIRMFDAILAALEGPGVDGGFINRWQEEMELETEMGGTIHPPKWQLEQMLKEAGVKILGKGAVDG